jgi:hypothetical protein
MATFTFVLNFDRPFTYLWVVAVVFGGGLELRAFRSRGFCVAAMARTMSRQQNILARLGIVVPFIRCFCLVSMKLVNHMPGAEPFVSSLILLSSTSKTTASFYSLLILFLCGEIKILFQSPLD